jgi:hypothetical protein
MSEGTLCGVSQTSSWESFEIQMRGRIRYSISNDFPQKELVGLSEQTGGMGRVLH